MFDEYLLCDGHACTLAIPRDPMYDVFIAISSSLDVAVRVDLALH